MPTITEQQAQRLASLMSRLRSISLNVQSQEQTRRRMKAFGAGLTPDDRLMLREHAEADARAACILAAAYVEGWANLDQPGDGVLDGRQRAIEEGIRLYERAGHEGNDHAQFTLGGFYEFGFLRRQDARQAATWYAMAAEHGHGQAQSALGRMLWQFEVPIDAVPFRKEKKPANMKGSGKKRTVSKGEPADMKSGSIERQAEIGFRLMVQAAEQGVWSAMFNVAHAYEHGQGVDKNRDEALRRYRELAGLGHPRAPDKVKELGGSFWRQMFTRKALS